MSITLNQEQAKSLANFFFDVAKGVILGGLGFATVTSLEVKIFAVLSSLVVTYLLVRFGLILLEDVRR